MLGPVDARRFRINPETLPPGTPSTGIGGQTPTRTIDAVLTLNGFTTRLALPVLTVPPGRSGFALPSLLGHDVIAQFALFLDHHRDRVLLLTPDEVADLPLP